MAKVTTYTVASFSLVMTEDEANKLVTLMQGNIDSTVQDMHRMLKKRLDEVKEQKKERGDSNARV